MGLRDSERLYMLDYKKMFKMRLIQIIVVNIIMIAVTIWLYREGDSFLDVFELWFFGSWLIESIIPLTSKHGGKFSEYAASIVELFFASSLTMFAGEFCSPLLVIWLFVIMCKLFFGAIALGVIIAVEFIAYPFTTVYYYIKSKREVV